MKRTPTKLIVEKGNILVTDKPMSVEPHEIVEWAGVDLIAWKKYNKALESWKKEVYKVVNPESIKSWWYPIMGNSLTYIHDGIYDCPDGLVFKVNERPLNACKSCNSLGVVHCAHPEECDEIKIGKVAILSFEEPQ